MRRRGTFLLFLILIGPVGLAPSGDVLACACCAEPGERHVDVGPYDEYMRALLGKVRFASRARLFVTDAGADDVRGLDSPSLYAGYDLRVTVRDEDISFAFEDKAGKSGTLSMTPVQVVERAIDPQPGSNGPGEHGHDLWFLYKELSFVSGRMDEKGALFKATESQNKVAILILHGRGNNCTDERNFRYWTLEVRDRSPDLRGRLFYRFYGKLCAPR